MPPVKHVFSWDTGASLEVPVFLVAVDDEPEPGVRSYVEVDDELDPVPGGARLQVRVLGLLDPPPPTDERREAVNRLVDSLTRGVRVVRRTDAEVDEEPTTTLVARDADGRTLHQTVVCTSRRLLSIAAEAPRPELLDAYDRMVATARFIDA